MLQLCVLLTAFAGISSAAQAIHVNEALKARQAVAFWGGYTLAHSGATCPSNTYECVGDNVVNGFDNSYACCPVGTYCWNGGETYCCPDENDCHQKLTTEPVCADTTWTLWEGVDGHGPFCCEPGETPIIDANAGFGECWSSGLPVVSSEIASTLTQIHVTFLPFTAAGHGGTATNTIAHPTSTTSTPGTTQSVISTVESDAAKFKLSKTAIIGIAVGGGIAFIIILLAVGCCCWKCCFKKRRRTETYSQTYEPYRAMDTPR